MKKQNFIMGSLILAFASFLAKVLGAVYRIPLTYILGAEGLGLYQLIFPLYSTLLVLCSTGVPNAIAKLIASGKEEQNKAIVKKSLLFFAGISLLMSLALALLAKPISALQGNIDVWIVYVGIAPAIFIVGILSVFRGYFQGKQNILPTSISLIIEQLFKLIFGLLFSSLLITKGLMYGALGAVLGVTVSEVFALLMISIQYFFARKTSAPSVIQDVSIKSIVKTTIPMTVSSMIMPLTLLIDSFLIINLLKHIGFSTSSATNLYGIMTGVVNSLINLPVVLSMAVSTMIIPIISKMFVQKDANSISEKVGTALEVVLLIVIPCAVLFFFFPQDIIFFLFKNGLKVGEVNEFQIAINLLRIGSGVILFIALVQIATTVLQSINMAKIPVYNMVGACFLKVLLTLVLVLIPTINIYGAMWSTLICYAVCAVLNLQKLCKTVKVRTKLRYSVIMPIIASFMMVASMFVIKRILEPSNLQILTMFLVGAVTYVLATFVFSYDRFLNKNTLLKFLKLRPKRE